MDDIELIQQRIKDQNGQITLKLYQKAQLLGKGGFAKCYRGIELQTQREVAIKVVEKSNLCRNRAKQKLLSEIKIHKALKHPYIVDFQTVFEDQKNVYIILQLCRCRTLGQMTKKRKRLTVPQTRYYIKQLLQALKYLHNCKVIHRDLKMGNIFLNQSMEMKLGDFGLSAKLEFCDEKKRTMAGTPNYIAPEIIQGTGGHSYEVDLWSTGVICYALLFGRPPFQTSQLKMTYSKIRNCEYIFPSSINVPQIAKDFIGRILVLDPKKRMSISDMEAHPFLNDIPRTIPKSALIDIPIFKKQDFCFLSRDGNPLETQAINNQEEPKNKILMNSENISLQSNNTDQLAFKKMTLKPNTSENGTIYNLRSDKKNNENNYQLIGNQNEALNPSYIPTNVSPSNLNICPKQTIVYDKVFCPHVIAHVDYSTKYGLGYFLNNLKGNQANQKVYGVYFNDCSILAYNQMKDEYSYITNPSHKDESVGIQSYSSQNYPEGKNYIKKKLLLQKFLGHLQEQLVVQNLNINEINKIQTDSSSVSKELIYVKQWLKTKHAIMFRLSNKIFQVDFQDKSQILLNTDKREVLFRSKKGNRIQASLSEALSQKQKDTQLGRRIKYTRQILNSLKKDKNY